VLQLEWGGSWNFSGDFCGKGSGGCFWDRAGRRRSGWAGRFLGHKKLNTTLIYARAHDQTVAEDYFTAMQRVEQRLEIGPPEKQTSDEVVKAPDRAQLFAWVERLALPELCFSERRELTMKLRCALEQTVEAPKRPADSRFT
jgi:hypothetical protein